MLAFWINFSGIFGEQSPREARKIARRQLEGYKIPQKRDYDRMTQGEDSRDGEKKTDFKDGQQANQTVLCY